MSIATQEFKQGHLELHLDLSYLNKPHYVWLWNDRRSPSVLPSQNEGCVNSGSNFKLFTSAMFNSCMRDMRNPYRILVEKVRIKLPSSVSYFFHCLNYCTAQHVLAIADHLQGKPIPKETSPDDFTILSVSNVL